MNQNKYRAGKILLLLATMLGSSILDSRSAMAIDSNFQPKIEQTTALPVGNNRPTAKIAQASDTAGNWAEPFIQVLVQKGIIAGYPDGTFQPDRAVTRAEFAALLNKAFELSATRESLRFSDIKSKFWAAAVIDKAYRASFLSGYPDKTFKPNEKILRIESLVSIANGNKLPADGSTVKIDELFTDTAQVPSFGRNALIAATQKCLAVSVSYPEGKTFNPTGAATRADVAAFIHQALVAAGKLTALASDSPAQKYIVNCAPTTPTVAKITEQDVLNRIGIGSVPNIDTAAPTIVQKPANPPVTGVTTPSAFGANWGTIFVGAGYQDSLSPANYIGVGGKNTSAIGVAGGFGLGNSRDFIGLETSYRTQQNDGGPAGGATSLGLFTRGSFNFKLHKQFDNNLAIAAGWENAIRNGYAAGDVTDKDTFYGVVTSVFPVSDTNNFTASLGVGNGRFRSLADIFANRSNSSVFGSLGFRVSENIGLVADYNGRNFSLGLPLSVKMSDNMGLQLTPSLLDFAGDKVAGENTQFGIGGGLAVRF